MNKISFLTLDYVKRGLQYVYTLFCGGYSCIICGKPSRLIPLCNDCIHTRFCLEDVPRCRICGKEIFTREELCPECRSNPVLHHLDKMVPMFSYRLWNKELLFLWKIKSVRSMSFVFAGWVNSLLKDLKVEFIVPVPPRPGKIKANGWDQIDELCNYLKYRYGFKVLNLLERRTNVQQKKMNREERLNSIEKSYCLCDMGKRFEILKMCGGVFPEDLCLIDDVFTTGATLESCSKVLKEAGVKRVSAVTLFIVD